jgi:hypothetical protein
VNIARRTVIVVSVCGLLGIARGFAQCPSTAAQAPAAAPTPAAPATPAATAGQTIGTIIKAAIQTAFPGVGTILNAFLGTNPATANKPDNTKVTVGQVKNGATTPSTQQCVQQEITAAIQPKLAPVSEVAGELAVVDQFLLPSVEASKNLTLMQADLAAQTVNWSDVQLNWSLVKIQLSKVKSVPDPQINSVSDLWLRNKLATIKNANDAPATIIEAKIAAKNSAETAAAVQSLAQVMDGMTAAAGYELANMQTDLTNLANWAKGAGGTVSPTNPFKAVADNAIH